MYIHKSMILAVNWFCYIWGDFQSLSARNHRHLTDGLYAFCRRGNSLKTSLDDPNTIHIPKRKINSKQNVELWVPLGQTSEQSKTSIHGEPGGVAGEAALHGGVGKGIHDVRCVAAMVVVWVCARCGEVA